MLSSADLSPFFAKKEARAVIVTDCKLDDALCLWYFFLLNLSRPPEHRVHIDIFVVGIKDLAGGVALVRHVFREAAQHVSVATGHTPGVQIEWEIYVSSQPGPSWACRHELDTFAPYWEGVPGFPQANRESLKYFQDLGAGRFGAMADFIGVICQYFAWVVSSEKAPGFDADMLDYIVPRAGGVLAFQMGFNTRLSGSQEDQKAVWDSLLGKVSSVGAKLALINNSFSFTKGELKAGSINPQSAPFVATLQRQCGQLWGHLIKAGNLESAIFTCDQIAKWIVGDEPSGMSTPPVVVEAVSTFCKALQLTPSNNIKEVSEMIKAVISSGDEGVHKVLSACTDLLAVCSQACGAVHGIDYLGRAEACLKKFGSSVEVTDGQHFLVLFQSMVPVLHPVQEMTWKEGAKTFGPLFGDTSSDAVIWAARHIDVAQSLDWMDRCLQVPAAYSLTLPHAGPVQPNLDHGRAAAGNTASVENLTFLVPDEGVSTKDRHRQAT